ncbi:hypothetical protein [Enterovibrio calviensis]|uniref:hypothetical protein n=1 Tax=Enterovibrio calviensis TaxID=91359 RepID=UPI000684936F|nr:hypothetical protein [Enterovibrio calviensis]
MSLQTLLGELRELIENRLDGKGVNLPEVRQQYVSFVQDQMPGRAYSHFPDDMDRWFEQLFDTLSAEMMADVHQLALVDLMLSSLRSLDSQRPEDNSVCVNTLPMVVIESVKEWFTYLADSMAAGDYEPDVTSDLFRKDLAISALNMWPSGSICHYEPRALPRRFLTANGITQFVSAADMLLRKIKDRQQMYELHMEDRRTNPHFLEAGWREFYLEIAQRMKSEPQISGIFAQSWFWDAEVIQASSKMAYLRNLPESGGASFYLLEACDDAEHVALQNKKRRRLFEEGKYTPKSYLMIWPREALLRWAKGQQPIQTTLTDCHHSVQSK